VISARRGLAGEKIYRKVEKVEEVFIQIAQNLSRFSPSFLKI
jgi:hypothetical protein